MLSYIGLLKMQGRINDPAALEHQESDENSLYTRFISFEHISQVLVIYSFHYHLVING